MRQENAIGGFGVAEGKDVVRMQCARFVMPALIYEPRQPNAVGEHIRGASKFQQIPI
jgi:hypothetical protein